MQTAHGIRYLTVLHLHGIHLGFDARWLGARGLGLMLLTLLTPAGPLNTDATIPLWVRVTVGFSSVLAVIVTSLGHELGHALAGRLAGLNVRAIVLAPEGGVTIRASSDRPHVNFRTALAGPLANAVFATASAGLALYFVPEGFLSRYLTQIGALQLLTAVANLLPLGPMDGSNILAAWRGFKALA
jgi:Zn-dependent protease